LKYANDILSNKEKIKIEEEYLSFDEIKSFIQKFNHIYNINLTLKRSQKAARFVVS